MAEQFNRVMDESDYRSKERRSRVLQPELVTPLTGHRDEDGHDDYVAPLGGAGRSRKPERRNRSTTTQRGQDQQ